MPKTCEAALVFLPTNRHSSVRRILGAILAALACCAIPISADEVRAPAMDVPASIVVTAKRAAADEEVKNKVETALHSDPYFYDGHVTVTVNDGVVHLTGWFMTTGICEPRSASARKLLVRNAWSMNSKSVLATVAVAGDLELRSSAIRRLLPSPRASSCRPRSARLCD